MTHDLGADLDELVAQSGQGPVFDSLGQGQSSGRESRRKRCSNEPLPCLQEPLGFGTVHLSSYPVCRYQFEVHLIARMSEECHTSPSGPIASHDRS